MMTYDNPIHINIPKKINSILKYPSAVFHEHHSDDSDSEEDENVRRKYINLRSGHGLLHSSTTFSAHLDLSKPVINDNRYFDKLLHKKENDFYSHDNKSSSANCINYNKRHIVPPLDLDAIDMNNDYEYGFNPNRLSGSKAGYAVKLRPISLYSPRPDKQKSALKYSNSDADERCRSESLSMRPISHASNDREENLEKELASIRSQPCNLEFQGCKGKINPKEFAEDLASSRRNRKLRRQLSFDSHPNRQWHKTRSLDSGLATDTGPFHSNYNKNFYNKRQETSQSQTLIDIDEGDHSSLSGMKKLCFSAEYISDDDLTPVSSPEDDVDAERSLQDAADTNEIIIVPKFVEDNEAPVREVLLSTESNSYNVTKPSEKQKRRSNIPHIPYILHALRLPNKKLKKLMKRRPSDGRSSPMKVSHDLGPVTLIEARSTTDEPVNDETGPIIVASMGKDNKSFTESLNTFEKPVTDIRDTTPSTRKEKSQSTHSLQKVDEDKESLEFKSPFTEHRRSKSSCSFNTNSKLQSQNEKNHASRRMSDTALPDKPQICQSPSKRFIRRLFSPVVCGLPSPDKRAFVNGSFISLRSYDSGSIVSECEDTPQLFDFGSHELMEEMTLIDKELFVRIPWSELSVLGWMSSDKNFIAPHIMKMVEFFNRVVMVVTSSILAEENIYRRAKIVQKAIKLALKFRYQRNYNSLKAVLTGLQCTPVFRLKHTWKQVPSRYRRVFRELSELMSEENNFYNYRMELIEAMQNPPCIPFLGNFLTTLAHVHTFVAVAIKCRNNSNKTTKEEDSDGYPASPSSLLSPNHGCGSNENLNNEQKLDNQIDPCLRSSTAKIHSATHMRTDSDDSGVVLNIHRLSRASDDLEPSPRECGTNSSDEDQHTGEKRDESPQKRFSESDASGINSKSENMKRLLAETRHRRSVSEIVISPTMRHNRSVSVNDVGFANEIANVINSKPVVRDDIDDLYRCELQFWKYQIAAVQYRIIPKSYIRRYLMNCPYNTEEENYKLSLQREPPAK